MNRIEELKELITKYDISYRTGVSLISDSAYDNLVDELIGLIGSEDIFFKSSIKEDIVSSDRREQLPITMASMNKTKTVKDLNNWMRLKNIPIDTELVISPKYDGISLCKEEKTKKAWTRGSSNNGGLKSDTHLAYLGDITFDAPYTFGECIISRENFKKVQDSFSGDAARNCVSGIFRRDYVSDELLAVDFIRYGVVGKNFNTKKEMFDYLNKYQKVSVPYKIEKIENLTEEYLKEIFIEFSKDYEIDGLILEVNDISMWNKLDRERDGNPKWAVAYKGAFEEVKETVVLKIENQISKDGNIIPIAILDPIKLDNALVSRVTLNNYSFLKEMGIGVGSQVKCKRSGMVIPLITEVVTKKEFVMPDIECYWDGVHLKTVHETDEQKKKKLFAFFNILCVENVSDKTFDLLFDSGYKTIKDILSMTKEQFLKLERFGDRKSEIVYDGIHSKMKSVELSKLRHASSFFSGLGSKKLILLEHFETTPTLEEILKVDGFSDISANIYLNGIEPFNSFYNEIKQFVTIKKIDKIIMENNKLEGMTFVFTGYRDKIAEVEIQKRGGRVTTSVSKNTNFLVMKQKGSGSSKENKALELGVTVLDAEDLAGMLK